MDSDYKLDTLYDQFVKGELDRTDFESRIYIHIANNMQRFRLATIREDERTEFLAWVYPRLSEAVETFRDTGSSFDAYIHNRISWGILDFKIESAERKTMERAYWTERSCEFTCEPEEEYCRVEEAESKKQKAGPVLSNPKQVLALALKCCFFVSDDFCEKIAPSLEVDAQELRQRMERLRVVAAERALRRSELEERAASLYYRSVVLAAKLASAPEDSKRRSKCELSLNATRKRLDSVRSRISRIRLDATNREIAAELGVPKGTIDSGLYFLRRRRGNNNPGTPLTKNSRNRYSAP